MQFFPSSWATDLTLNLAEAVKVARAAGYNVFLEGVNIKIDPELWTIFCKLRMWRAESLIRRSIRSLGVRARVWVEFQLNTLAWCGGVGEQLYPVLTLPPDGSSLFFYSPSMHWHPQCIGSSEWMRKLPFFFFLHRAQVCWIKSQNRKSVSLLPAFKAAFTLCLIFFCLNAKITMYRFITGVGVSYIVEKLSWDPVNFRCFFIPR